MPLFRMSSSDESSDRTAGKGRLEEPGDGTGGEGQTPAKKQKKEKEHRNRGNKMTPAKRCLYFPKSHFFYRETRCGVVLGRTIV